MPGQSCALFGLLYACDAALHIAQQLRSVPSWVNLKRTWVVDALCFHCACLRPILVTSEQMAFSVSARMSTRGVMARGLRTLEWRLKRRRTCSCCSDGRQIWCVAWLTAEVWNQVCLAQGVWWYVNRRQVAPPTLTSLNFSDWLHSPTDFK